MPDTVEKKKPNMPRSPAPARQQETLHADAARTLEAGLPLSSVVDKLREAVEEGEGWAVMLWLAYYWGRPSQRARGTAMARRSVREATDEELAEAMRGAAAAEGHGSAPPGGEGGSPPDGPDTPDGEER